MTQPDFAARNQVDVLLRARAEALTMRWLAVTGAVGALAIVLTILASSMPEPVSGVVTVLAWLVAAVLAALSIVLPRRALADRHIASWLRAPLDGYRWAVQLGLSPAQREVFLALPPNEQSVLALTIPFVRPYTQGLALALGVALVGFAYGLSCRAVLEAAPFLVAALALNCWHYPRLGTLIDRGRKLLSAAEMDDEARALANLHAQPSDAPEKPAGPRLRSSQVTPRVQRKSRAGELP
jgi:hypothetical protein